MMDKILIAIDLEDNKNVITIIDGDIAESELFNRKEIIEQLNSLIEFLMPDEVNDDRL